MILDTVGEDTARTGLGLDLSRDRAVTPNFHMLHGNREWRSPGPSGELHVGTERSWVSRSGPTQPLTCQETSLWASVASSLKLAQQ